MNQIPHQVWGTYADHPLSVPSMFPADKQTGHSIPYRWSPSSSGWSVSSHTQLTQCLSGRLIIWHALVMDASKRIALIDFISHGSCDFWYRFAENSIMNWHRKLIGCIWQSRAFNGDEMPRPLLILAQWFIVGNIFRSRNCEVFFSSKSWRGKGSGLSQNWIRLGGCGCLIPFKFTLGRNHVRIFPDPSSYDSRMITCSNLCLESCAQCQCCRERQLLLAIHRLESSRRAGSYI